MRSPAYGAAVLKTVLYLIVTCSLFSLLTSCGRAPTPPTTPPPAAYFPELFNDIPLPMFYTRMHGCDQVAAVYGGGGLRHLDITLQEVEQDSRAERDQALHQWYELALIGAGWTPVPDKLLPRDVRRYRKSLNGRHELLELRTGRAKKLSIIRLRFIKGE